MTVLDAVVDADDRTVTDDSLGRSTISAALACSAAAHGRAGGQARKGGVMAVPDRIALPGVDSAGPVPIRTVCGRLSSMAFRSLIVLAAALLIPVAGCATPAAPPSAAAKPPPGTLVVSIPPGSADTVTADGWTVAERDLPAYVAHRHATAVVVRGSPGTPYDRALRIEAELQQVGVRDVTIAPIAQ